MNASERLERLLHEIQNNLQVIEMEAGLLKKAGSEQSQTISDAIQDIAKLLEEVKGHFTVPLVTIAVKATKSGKAR